MKRNAVAWAALVLSLAALVGSRNFSRAVPAAQDIPAEGQKAAKALSEAFEAVADFVKPSVVQISVEKKGGLGGLFGGGGGRGGAPFRFFGDPGQMNPKDLKDLLKRMHPDLNDDQLDDLLKQLPKGGESQPRPRSNRRESRETPKGTEKLQFDFHQQGTGSGFIYDEKGHILTNNHVVADAEKITVTFHDGETAEAKVVGTDPDADVAVIKVDNTSYRPLPRGKSKSLRVGEWVLAFGSPFGLSQTVTAGIISATERSMVEVGQQNINKYEAFIQTDCAINPGNSGGPLVDMNGRVIGVNSAIATLTRSNAGVGFAIPIDMASLLADKLIKDGKVSRARVGIALEPLTPTKARKIGLDPKTKGVIAGDVVKDSPAAKAGLKGGDVITSFDGNPVYSISGFRNIVSTSDTGKSYELKYLRDGKEHSATITPAPEAQVVFDLERQLQRAQSEQTERDRTERERPKRAQPTRSEGFGLGVKELTTELAKKYGYPEGTQGLVVQSVDEGSAAEAAGLEEGDVITKVVKGENIENVRSAKDLKDAAGDGDELSVMVKDVRNPKNPAKLTTLTKGERVEKE
jgi:serine protease Do